MNKLKAEMKKKEPIISLPRLEESDLQPLRLLIV